MNLENKELKEKLKEFERTELNDYDTKVVRKDAGVIYENLEKIINFKKEFENNNNFSSQLKIENEKELEKYNNLIENENLWNTLKEDLGFEESEQKKNNDDRTLTNDEKREIKKEIDLLKKKISYSNWNYGADPYRKERNVKVDGQKLYSFWDSKSDKKRKLEKLLRDDRLAGSVSKKIEPPKMIKVKKIEQINSLTFLYGFLMGVKKEKETQIKNLENSKINGTTNLLLGFYKTEKEMIEKNFLLIEKIYDVLDVKRRLREELIFSFDDNVAKDNNNTNIEKNNVMNLKINDKVYPENLKKINNAPNILYTIGNLKLLDEMKNKKIMAVTNLTNFELESFKKLFSGLKDEFVFVTTSYDKNLIDFMNKNDFVFIVVSEINVEKTKKLFDITERDISKNKCLIITESPLENNKLLGLDNSFVRIWMGLAMNAYIGSENRRDYLFKVSQYLNENKINGKSFGDFVRTVG